MTLEQLQEILARVTPADREVMDRAKNVRPSWPSRLEVWESWRKCPFAWQESPAGCVIR